jgi:hypothetical protein
VGWPAAVPEAIFLPLAHHGLLLAIPFFGPVLLIAAFVVTLQIKDRRDER